MPVQPRKPWIAALLSIGCPGLGHVYLGQAARGLLLWAAMLLGGILLALVVFRLPLFPLGPSLALLAELGLLVFIVADAVRAARRQRAVFQPKRYNRWYVYLLVFLASLAIHEVVHGALIWNVTRAFRIPSDSMLPTLESGDYLLADTLRYSLAPIRRGDVIVFKFPPDESRDMIKRVIGLPGETVEVRGKEVLINGVPLREPYARYEESPAFEGRVRESLGPLLVPPGRLFVLGDNRDRSLDSRMWGFLEIAKVRGKVVGVYFSWDAEARRVRWARIGTTLH